jgi:hypothetical protein
VYGDCGQNLARFPPLPRGSVAVPCHAGFPAVVLDAVAVRAHDVALRHLGLDLGQPEADPHGVPDVEPLLLAGAVVEVQCPVVVESAPGTGSRRLVPFDPGPDLAAARRLPGRLAAVADPPAVDATRGSLVDRIATARMYLPALSTRHLLLVHRPPSESKFDSNVNGPTSQLPRNGAGVPWRFSR